MTVRRTVTNFIDKAQLTLDMRYSLVDLSDAMIRQSSLLVHYGVLQAQASKQVDDVAMLRDVAESKIYRKLRDAAAVAGVKLTEMQLEMELKSDPTIVSFKRALNEAKQIEAIAKIAVKGFMDRKDMLVQHGAMARKEMDGEITTRRREIVDEGFKASASRVAAAIAAKNEG
jgi:hypothetical protein